MGQSLSGKMMDALHTPKRYPNRLVWNSQKWNSYWEL